MGSVHFNLPKVPYDMSRSSFLRKKPWNDKRKVDRIKDPNKTAIVLEGLTNPNSNVKIIATSRNIDFSRPFNQVIKKEYNRNDIANANMLLFALKFKKQNLKFKAKAMIIKYIIYFLSLGRMPNWVTEK